MAVLMLIIGGIHFFFAGGDPGKLETGKRILLSTAIGLLVIFGGYIIVNSVMSFTGFLNPTFFSDPSDPSKKWAWNDPSTWFKVPDCPY
jgi:hypothetical protein